MVGKTLLVGLCAIVLLVPASAAAQTAYYTRIEGTVYVKQPDGTEKYVSGALVEIYALDIFKQQWKVKTSKRGFYTQNAVLEYGRYLVVVSGPGIEPAWVNNVQPRLKNTINIRTRPGDGTRLSVDQVFGLMSRQNGTSWTEITPTNLNISELNNGRIEAAKKEYEAKGDKTALENITQAADRYGKGVEMMKVGDFQAALSHFEQAATLATQKQPAFAELLCHLSANSAETHYQIGVSLFNLRKRDEARASFESAIFAAKNAIRIASASADPATSKELLNYHDGLARNYLLLIEYFGAVDYIDETFKLIDKAGKIDSLNKRWDLLRGDLCLKVGRADDAVAAYSKVLTAEPQNLDALYGLSLVLVESTEKEKLLQAERNLNQFIIKAPPTDKRVATAKVMIESLKGRAR
jgi:tetratricopeptide (TPR) repeat protein